MDEQHPVSVEFNGVTYRRNPEAQQRSHRVYYSARGHGYLHRAIWRHHNGPIPKGGQIHHKDHDPFNNDPGNLVCVTSDEHAQEHAEEFRAQRRAHADRIRPLASEWHGSEEGRAWHSEHGRRTWEQRAPAGESTCNECGTPITVWFEGKQFCSSACSRRAADREQRYHHMVPCPVCGTEFAQSKYRARPAACSRKCGWVLRKQKGGS